MQRHFVFPPVVGNNPKALILGTFPSLASRAEEMPYAHPRNQFWPILFHICGEPYAGQDKLYRQAMLRRHGIALWDMVESCETEGSADTEIKNPKLVDLKGFLKQYPTIRLVCFNGGTAARFAKKAGMPEIACVTLPSTSPANARYSPEEKLAIWQAALKPVLPSGPVE